MQDSVVVFSQINLLVSAVWNEKLQNREIVQFWIFQLFSEQNVSLLVVLDSLINSPASL